jgi:hypothetical protein
MGHAREKQHKKQGFIYLEDAHGPFDRVCAPKRKCVDTVPTAANQQRHPCGTLSHHGCPLFTSSTTHAAHQTQREAGPDDQLRRLGLGMFLYTQVVVSFN